MQTNLIGICGGMYHLRSLTAVSNITLNNTQNVVETRVATLY